MGRIGDSLRHSQSFCPFCRGDRKLSRAANHVGQHWLHLQENTNEQYQAN